MVRRHCEWGWPIGLCRGRALLEAISLAREVAALPQTALRSDRLSSYAQWSKPLQEALAAEYRHGMATLRTGQFQRGLERYASGQWRQKKFVTEPSA
jgi:enoyl-CoA hydratase